MVHESILWRSLSTVWIGVKQDLQHWDKSLREANRRFCLTGAKRREWGEYSIRPLWNTMNNHSIPPFPTFSTSKLLESCSFFILLNLNKFGHLGSSNFPGWTPLEAYADKKGHLLRCLEYSKPLGAEGAWMQKDSVMIPCRDRKASNFFRAEECWDQHIFSKLFCYWRHDKIYVTQRWLNDDSMMHHLWRLELWDETASSLSLCKAPPLDLHFRPKITVY